LDLGGMPEFIKVLSGRIETVAELCRLMEEVGSMPEACLPIFMGRAG
jgi:type IV secretion system protein VirB4